MPKGSEELTAARKEEIITACAEFYFFLFSVYVWNLSLYSNDGKTEESNDSGKSKLRIYVNL